MNPLDYDSVREMQGGLPHLLQLLKEEYTKNVEIRMNSALAKGVAVKFSLAEAVKRAPLWDFMEFAVDYLETNRVVETFSADSNVGIVFSDLSRCVVCPGFEVEGTMQDSESVGVTHGKGQSKLNGVSSTEGLGL